MTPHPNIPKRSFSAKISTYLPFARTLDDRRSSAVVCPQLRITGCVSRRSAHSHDEFGLEHDFGLVVTTSNAIQEHPGCLRANFIFWYPEGGERGGDQASDHYVVTPYDRDVIRNP